MPDYFDIDEMFLTEQGYISDLLLLKDLKQRKIFLNGEIFDNTVSDAIKYILQFNKDDAYIPKEERQPIRIFITSNGGDVDAGFGLIDAIKASVTPVYTINLSYQYSMAFLIGIAGHKRFTMPNAKFLMHDGSTYLYNSSAKAKETMEFYKRTEAATRQYVIDNSKIDGQTYDEKYGKEWYLTAEDAKENGFVDYIIGTDCGLDEII